nr:glycosyltransferase family 4 protein [Rhodospirillum rubrum]
MHVAKDYHPQGSGVARHIDGLITACRPLGVEARVLTAGEGGLWRAVGAADVVHLHGARTACVARAALVARLLDRPMIYTPHCYYDHGSWPKRLAKRLWDRLVERPLVARAWATILLDEIWRGDLIARGLSPQRAVVVPNCITPDQGAPGWTGGRLAGRPALLSIGRLDRVKRLDDMITALTFPGLESAVLHLVGEGGDQGRLGALAALDGLGGRVIFHGGLDDETTARMRAGADLFLLASEREGLPTVMLETLAVGLPILVSDIPANRALADALGWPALFALGDQGALARGVLRWAGRPVPALVRDRLAARFTWAARAGEIVGLYHEAMGHKDKAAGR